MSELQERLERVHQGTMEALSENDSEETVEFEIEVVDSADLPIPTSTTSSAASLCSSLAESRPATLASSSVSSLAGEDEEQDEDVIEAASGEAEEEYIEIPEEDRSHDLSDNHNQFVDSLGTNQPITHQEEPKSTPENQDLSIEELENKDKATILGQTVADVELVGESLLGRTVEDNLFLEQVIEECIQQLIKPLNGGNQAEQSHSLQQINELQSGGQAEPPPEENNETLDANSGQAAHELEQPDPAPSGLATIPDALSPFQELPSERAEFEKPTSRETTSYTCDTPDEGEKVGLKLELKADVLPEPGEKGKEEDEEKVSELDHCEREQADGPLFAADPDRTPQALPADHGQVFWAEHAEPLSKDDAEEEEQEEEQEEEEPAFIERQLSVKKGCVPEDFYELGAELGRGKFGTVYRCIDRNTGEQFAAKFINLRRNEDREDVLREIAIMSMLQHRRLLQLADAFDELHGRMCLITELIEGGELFERIIDDDFDLTEGKAAYFMKQICEGIHYMHSKAVVHLDMKPENVLCVSRKGSRVKLIDFGLARQLQPGQTLRVMFGTPDFAAPEVLTYEDISLATDMWSIGVICYLLLSGLSPFMGDNDLETMANVISAAYEFDEDAFAPISEEAKDFIGRLLQRDQLKRLRPDECLDHPWLKRARLERPSAGARRAHGATPAQEAAQEAATGRLDDGGIPSGGLGGLGGGPMELELEAELQDWPDAVPRRQSMFTETRRPTLTGQSQLASQHTAPHPERSYTLPLFVSLDKRNLKRYVVRRKWHRSVHAILALGRMGASLRTS